MLRIMINLIKNLLKETVYLHIEKGALAPFSIYGLKSIYLYFIYLLWCTNNKINKYLFALNIIASIGKLTDLLTKKSTGNLYEH